MIIKNVYILSHGNDIKLVASNFLIIYTALKKYRKRLGIAKIQAYSTLVAKARKGEMLVFGAESETPYFVEQRVVARKKVHICELSDKPF